LIGVRAPIEKAEAGSASAVVFRGLPIGKWTACAGGCWDGWGTEDQEEDEELELGEVLDWTCRDFLGKRSVGGTGRMEEVKMTSLGGKRWKMHARNYEIFFSFLVSPRFVFR
jgi:hypothetical protein